MFFYKRVLKVNYLNGQQVRSSAIGAQKKYVQQVYKPSRSRCNRFMKSLTTRYVLSEWVKLGLMSVDWANGLTSERSERERAFIAHSVRTGRPLMAREILIIPKGKALAHENAWTSYPYIHNSQIIPQMLKHYINTVANIYGLEGSVWKCGWVLPKPSKKPFITYSHSFLLVAYTIFVSRCYEKLLMKWEILLMNQPLAESQCKQEQPQPSTSSTMFPSQAHR